MTKTLFAVTLAALAGAPAAIAANAYESQIADLRDALATDPNAASTMLRLAIALRGIGMNDEAARLERQAYTLEPAWIYPGARLPGDQTDGGCTPNTGPDVIVGDLSDIGNYTSGAAVNGLLGFAVGTTSCNIGDANVPWVSNTNHHPVIGQSMYRIKDGRIEQIGQSWLKHGFTALTQNLCCTCSGQGGSVLGVGCSDPYVSSLNGSQGNLGPKFQVNACTGVYTYPSNFIGWTTGATAITKRIQVKQDDLDPALNSGAIYIAEAQYISFEDAQFSGQLLPGGNGLNNASYKRFTYSWNGATRTVTGSPSWVGATVRMKPAILAWQDLDPTVTIVNADVPGEGGGNRVGRFIVGYKVTDNGNGTWNYEYAIHNLNSDRAARSFEIAVTGAPTITNMGFHDVPYHSGDGFGSTTTTPINFDGTDWATFADAGSIRWNTDSADSNPNANALRWGTMYNFRFTANRPPVATTATIGLFKTGNPGSLIVNVVGPACLLAGDINGDGHVDFADLQTVLSFFGTTYHFSDLNNVLAFYGQSC